MWNDLSSLSITDSHIAPDKPPNSNYIYNDDNSYASWDSESNQLIRSQLPAELVIRRGDSLLAARQFYTQRAAEPSRVEIWNIVTGEQIITFGPYRVETESVP